VLVGERWVASMATKQWTQIGLGNEMRKHLPGVLKSIVPYRAFGRLVNSDWHICGMLHESFHAYQGIAQCFLLDRLAPDWKTKAMTPGVFLEDLLRQALSTSG